MRTHRNYAIAAVLALGAMIGVTSAFAQSRPLRAEIPFDFYVGDKLLPAGAYILNTTLQGTVIRVWDQKGSDSAFVMTTSHKPNHATNVDRLTFHRYGNTSFLTGIFWAEYANGRELATSSMEQQFARDGSRPISVAILVK